MIRRNKIYDIKIEEIIETKEEYNKDGLVSGTNEVIGYGLSAKRIYGPITSSNYFENETLSGVIKDFLLKEEQLKKRIINKIITWLRKI